MWDLPRVSEPKITGFNSSALFPNTGRQTQMGTGTVHCSTYTLVGRELQKSETPPETSVYCVLPDLLPDLRGLDKQLVPKGHCLSILTQSECVGRGINIPGCKEWFSYAPLDQTCQPARAKSAVKNRQGGRCEWRAGEAYGGELSPSMPSGGQQGANWPGWSACVGELGGGGGHEFRKSSPPQKHI